MCPDNRPRSGAVLIGTLVGQIKVSLFQGLLNTQILRLGLEIVFHSMYYVQLNLSNQDTIWPD